MGAAYGVGLILIYLLVVAQFRSYLTPLVIMAPIPLTLIGVMPGHALLGAQFTATSMIGMIALAGIIVRNSILLVDFIEQRLKLRNPIYSETAAYGHMGRKPEVVTKTFRTPDGKEKKVKVELFTWEKLDYVAKVKKAFGLK